MCDMETYGIFHFNSSRTIVKIKFKRRVFKTFENFIPSVLLQLKNLYLFKKNIYTNLLSHR